MRTSWSKAHHWTIKHLMMTTGTCKMPPKGHLANNSPSPRLVSTWTDCTMLVLLNFQSAYLLQNTIIVDTRNKSRNDFFFSKFCLNFPDSIWDGFVDSIQDKTGLKIKKTSTVILAKLRGKETFKNEWEVTKACGNLRPSSVERPVSSLYPK